MCKDIDIYSAFEVLKESFPNETRHTDYKDFNYEMNYRLRKGESSLFGLKIDGILASVVEILCHSNKNVLIGFLATREEYRNKGYGSSLLKCVLTEFSNKNVLIFADNDRLSIFYEKMGFRKVAVWAQLETARKD